MTLEEAAGWTLKEKQSAASGDSAYNSRRFRYDDSLASTLTDNILRSEKINDKARWQEAVQNARDRGLDCSDVESEAGVYRTRSFSKARRHPVKHAEVLLNETSLPIQEIMEITGLNVYQVVSLKLKLRAAA